MRGLSLVVASGGHSSSRCAGLSLSRPLLLRSAGSRRAGSVAVAHGPSCSAACGIFPAQGSNPCPLHWQADSQPLRHQGSPKTYFLKTILLEFYRLFPAWWSHAMGWTTALLCFCFSPCLCLVAVNNVGRTVSGKAAPFFCGSDMAAADTPVKKYQGLQNLLSCSFGTWCKSISALCCRYRDEIDSTPDLQSCGEDGHTHGHDTVYKIHCGV